MKNLIKLFIIAVNLTSFVMAATPKIITNYPDLVTALAKGDTIRAIIQLNNDFLGSMDFTHFNKYPVKIGTETKNTVATSFTMITEHPEYGPVYNYVRLRIFEDNSVELFSEFLSPQDYSKKKDPSITKFHLGDDGTQQKITLYDLSCG